jgi:hypothetical protein
VAPSFLVLKTSPMTRGLLFCAAVVLFVSPSQSLACASCGSGSDDPLVLWPNERLKTYLAIASSQNLRPVDERGRVGESSGPKSLDMLIFAIGKAVREDLFFTFTLPVIQNRTDDGSLRSLGDLVTGARWTWLQSDFTRPLVPQIQLMGSHSFPIARAQQESSRLDLLDVFGSAVPETKIGVDTFWGQSSLKGGFAVAGLFSSERTLGSSSVFPGNGIRSTVTLGYSLGGLSKWLIGGVQELREERRDDGRRVPESNVAAYSFFTTFDWSLLESHMLRLSVTDKGRLLANRNTVAATSVSLAWMSTLD